MNFSATIETKVEYQAVYPYDKLPSICVVQPITLRKYINENVEVIWLKEMPINIVSKSQDTKNIRGGKKNVS